jgi:uncharacterized membrane protein
MCFVVLARRFAGLRSKVSTIVVETIMKRDAWFWILMAACLVGILVSAISLSNHYSSKSSFCSVSEKIDCDIVNKGPYSTIIGIPVALLGVLGYLVFGLIVIKEKQMAKLLSFKRKEIWLYIAIIATIMFLFALYLSALEAFVIHAYCILCLMSQVMVLLLLIGAWIIKIRCDREDF